MFSRLFLRVCDSIFNIILFCILLVAGIYAGYSLWDNNQVLIAAEDVQADMLKLKPKIDSKNDQTISFEELLDVNQDVIGWLTMDNTLIDFPILQGKDNLTYINRDVYGNFALAGSIYLDSRNERCFEDSYSLLYGHHMANGKMFGDLDLYKEKEFFDENMTGTLILPNQVHELEVYAYLLVSASDDFIFEPDRWEGDSNRAYKYVKQKAVYLREDILETVENDLSEKTLALSTCSSEYTDARTIVLARIVP